MVPKVSIGWMNGVSERAASTDLSCVIVPETRGENPVQQQQQQHFLSIGSCMRRHASSSFTFPQHQDIVEKGRYWLIIYWECAAFKLSWFIHYCIFCPLYWENILSSNLRLYPHPAGSEIKLAELTWLGKALHVSRVCCATWTLAADNKCCDKAFGVRVESAHSLEICQQQDLKWRHRGLNPMKWEGDVC